MFFKKKNNLMKAKEKAEAAVDKTNEKIEKLGIQTNNLFNTLNNLQYCFDAIRNIPKEKKLQYEELKKIRLNWKQEAENLEQKFKAREIEYGGGAVAGVGVGIAVVSMGPTVAMGIATTFGVASTGTAISALSGAAATNAALAWLGGGALAIGGGGIAAGETVLAMSGPIGWIISALALIISGLLFFFNRKKKKRVDNIIYLMSERDIRSCDLAIKELNERISRIDDEYKKLLKAIDTIKGFGLDYNIMTEKQQYELGSYVNFMEASTQLLILPISGLLPKYSEIDFDNYCSWPNKKINDKMCKTGHKLFVYLANQLYKIELDSKDKKLLWKRFRRNKKMLKILNVSKKYVSFDVFNLTFDLLDYKYLNEENINT